MNNPLREYSRYFFPLAFQSAAQSVTYPLVAIVASNGSGGSLEVAAIAQSNSLMFLLGTLGAGLMTTGMVFAGTSGGYRSFCRLNSAIMWAVVAMQAVLCVPVLSHWVFGTLIGLPPGIEDPARIGFLVAIPLNMLFFLRTPYQVVLYVHRETGLASAATLTRIVLTVSLAPLFVAFGLTGVAWAVVCQTVGAAVEALVSWHFARRFLRAPQPGTSEPPSVRRLFAFTMPLSLGGFFLTLSGVVIGMVIARAARADEMLAAYYIAAGVAGPLAYACTRFQTLAIAFPPRDARDRGAWWFTGVVATVFGFVPLVFVLPGVADWYYVALQKLPVDNLDLVRVSAYAMIVHPLGVAVRAFTEGRAAHLKRPVTVLAGQAAYLGILAAVSIAMLFIAVPGNLIAPISMFVANTGAAGVMHLALFWEREHEGTTSLMVRGEGHG